MPAKNLATTKETMNDTTEDKATQTQEVVTQVDDDFKNLIPLLENVLKHLGSVGSVAYYTMLNCLFCINLWLFVSVYRLLV